MPELRALCKQAAERDREVVLGGDVDLQVRRAERAVDGSEATQEVIAQRFAHAFAADDGRTVVLAPVDPGFVDELLQEGRVAED